MIKNGRKSLRTRSAAGLIAMAALGGGVAGTIAGITGISGIAGADTASTAATAAPAPADVAAPADAAPPARGVHNADDVATAATVLGMSESDLQSALQGGKSLAQVASDQGVDVQKVIDALVAADTKAIDDAVAAGTLTQAQADQLKAGLADHVNAEVNQAGGPGRGGPDGHHGGPGGPGGVHHADDVATAATVVGMSESDLQSALQGGKSLAQVASDQGVDVQKVIDALVAADTKAIDDAVAAGTLTQAQADQLKAGLADHVNAEVNQAGGPGRGGPGGHHGGPGRDGPAASPSAPSSSTPSSSTTAS